MTLTWVIIVLDPFTAGMLYFFPRDTFRRPENFPFMDQVAGHSDPQMARLGCRHRA